MINKMKERKAQGPDHLKAEALMYADRGTKMEIRRQINEILLGKIPPEEWGESLIYPIYKKGDPRDPGNYRGIAIGNAAHKLLANIVQERLRKFLEDNNLLPDTQSGFREGRSTIDSLYILNSIINKTLERKGGRLFAFFVDFKTAFDTVNRGSLWKIMDGLGVPSYLLHTIMNMYRNVSYSTGGTKFQSHVGLKQGCPLSPLLFVTYIAALDQTLLRNQVGGVIVGRSKKIHCLAFADDLVLLSYTEGELKDMIKATHRFARTKDLIVNVNKSKVMMFSNGGRSSNAKWLIEGSNYEEVDEFSYLGVTLQRNGKFNRHRQGAAARARKRAAEVWSIAERTFKTNFRVRMEMFDRLVAPILLYGAEIIGYEEAPEYEIIRRRYLRWTMGLAQNTRTEVLELEAGGESVREQLVSRAISYEAGMLSRRSALVKAAWDSISLSGEGGRWQRQRGTRLKELGWNIEDFRNGVVNNEPLASTGLTKTRLLETLRKRRNIRDLKWYYPPKTGLPEYLRTNHAEYKLIARFRCGNEFRGNHTWREDRLCRLCGKVEETAEHLGSHDEQRRGMDLLMKENGAGVDWMRAVCTNL